MLCPVGSDALRGCCSTVFWNSMFVHAKGTVGNVLVCDEDYVRHLLDGCKVLLALALL